MFLDERAPVDAFGRSHESLRVSLTDRCNIACFHCMPGGNPAYAARREILSYEEILRFVRVAGTLGIGKIRLTGGEPLVRRHLDRLVREMVPLPGIRDVALTTNGLLLAEQAPGLRAAGLARINVHLDTLDPGRFRRLTGRDGLAAVLAGIDKALELGFSPVKLNAVAVKGLSEPDLAPLARFGRERGIRVRFIEYMPLDAGGGWRRDQVLTAADILDILGREIGALRPSAEPDPRSPTRDFDFVAGPGGVGIIAPISRPFCASCNRLRLTADGRLRNCLFARDELDARVLLRDGGSDEAIAALIRRSVGGKWEGHDINTTRFRRPGRPMHAIGG
jgi:GTP 3',8-cyclase